MSTELAPGKVRWRAVIPGGQVDRPSDRNWEDQIPAWLENQPGDQPYSRDEVAAAGRYRVLFAR